MVRSQRPAVLVALWALVMLPTLCTADIMGHPCDCGMSAECKHEPGCSTDPCNRLTASREQRSDDLTVLVPYTVSRASFISTPKAFPCKSSLGIDELFGRKHLSCHRSDVPLLI